jgi:hypothetical protein
MRVLLICTTLALNYISSCTVFDDDKIHKPDPHPGLLIQLGICNPASSMTLRTNTSQIKRAYSYPCIRYRIKALCAIPPVSPTTWPAFVDTPGVSPGDSSKTSVHIKTGFLLSVPVNLNNISAA